MRDVDAQGHGSPVIDFETPRPWMVYDQGWLICMMCPMAKQTRKGDPYYRAVNTRRKTRKQTRRWVMIHLRCGFEGLR